MTVGRMTAPRPRRPGTLYIVGRRTERRVHLFRPDDVTNREFLYCLGVALERTGVSLVAIMVMSNHYHLVLEDHHGSITKFTEMLNQLLTKTRQVSRGWTGRVFDAEGPSYVELLTPLAAVDRIAYCLANPTAAGLVWSSADWPGLRTRVEDLGVAVIKVARPRGYFADDGDMPAEVELRLEMPQMLLHVYGIKQARERIAAAVERHEQVAHEKAAKLRWKFAGVERVLKRSPYSRAKTLEERRELNPRYAGDVESIRAAVARDREFVRRYNAARERWLRDDTRVVWPDGTDALRRRYGVPCHPS